LRLCRGQSVNYHAAIPGSGIPNFWKAQGLDGSMFAHSPKTKRRSTAAENHHSPAHHANRKLSMRAFVNKIAA
jgi:hypothetical protein